MKVIYSDSNTELCPPSLIETTETERDIIHFLWEYFHPNQPYVTVDPLSGPQVLYIEVSEIPFGKLFLNYLKRKS